MISVNAVPLNQVCDIGNGFAFKSTQFQQSGVPLLRISNISNSRVDFGKGTVYLEETYLTTHKNFLVHKGDVVIALSGATTGKYGVYLHEEPCLLNQRIGIIRKGKSEKLDLQYFYFYLAKLKSEILSKAQGAAQPNISTKDIGQFKIPLPPLPEQQKIAAILDAADQLRQKDQQLIEHYTRLGQALFLEMFGDPITNPMGWNLSRVDALCSIVRGSSPRPKGDPRYYGGNVPRLMVADLTRDGKHVIPKIDSLTEEGAKKSRPINAGTVVMAVSGNVGLPAILSVNACIHDGFIAFNNLDTCKILPDFFVDLMMFLKSTHASRQAGAIFKNLTTSQIKEMMIPLPPLDIQHNFHANMQAIEQQKQQAQASLEKSEALFNSLLQRAFKGKLTG